FDACCLINILAAAPALLPLPGIAGEQLPGRKTKNPSQSLGHYLGINLHVPAKVSDEETLYLLQPDQEQRDQMLVTPIDLNPYFQAGLINRCNFINEKEEELFVTLAARLDDGEAACLAIAKERGWLLATDDRKAQSLAAQLDVVVLTT